METLLEVFFSADAWVALLTLTLLEIVLGIDNIVFISILSSKLPVERQATARYLGLVVAMATRILLLFSLSFIMRLTAPWLTILGHAISGRDVILLIGGLFLIAKSTFEIHEKMELASKTETMQNISAVSFASVIVQIGLLDIVFSLDSVITAIGMTDRLPVMVLAIVIAVGVMMLSANAISEFVDRHPTVKILALSFLILIGVALLGEGLELHIPKGYIYFAMAFSVVVEMLNLRLRGGKARPKADASAN
jgi:predicted tellurium resistance membrane protein TerC